jgi:hypothetical protein
MGNVAYQDFQIGDKVLVANNEGKFNSTGVVINGDDETYTVKLTKIGRKNLKEYHDVLIGRWAKREVIHGPNR